MDQMDMERIVPMDIILRKKTRDEESLLDGAEGFNKMNIGEAKDIIQYIKNNYYTYTTKDILLENGDKTTEWNLKCYGDKMICPVSLDDGDIIYKDDGDYSFVFMKVYGCDAVSQNDYAKVLDSARQEKYTVKGGDIFSKQFWVGLAISKESQLKGKQYTGYLFSLIKGQNSIRNAICCLLKDIFLNLGYNMVSSMGTDNQSIQQINDKIKKVVIAKKINVKTMGGGNEEEISAELVLKSKTALSRLGNAIQKLLGREGLSEYNLEIADSFRNGGKDNAQIKVTTNDGSREKTYNLESHTEQGIIGLFSKEIASTDKSFKDNEFVDLCLNHVKKQTNG